MEKKMKKKFCLISGGFNNEWKPEFPELVDDRAQPGLL